MNVLYPAIFEYDKSEKRYTVSFPDLSEAITEGETLEEAVFNASEVLTLTLEGRVDEGIDIPRPSSRKSAKYIAPLLQTCSYLSIGSYDVGFLLQRTMTSNNRCYCPIRGCSTG